MELSGEIRGFIYVKQSHSAGHLAGARTASCPCSPWAALPGACTRVRHAAGARWACGPGVGLSRVPGSPGTLSKVLKAEDIMGSLRGLSTDLFPFPQSLRQPFWPSLCSRPVGFSCVAGSLWRQRPSDARFLRSASRSPVALGPEGAREVPELTPPLF